MKKTLCFCLITVMMLAVFAGCSNLGNHEIDPASAVRILLASERLNAALLKNEGDIFENGVQVMKNLSVQTTASVIKLGAEKPKGKVSFDGSTYLFSDFEEISNSYSNFESTAKGITTMAEEAATLIDNIKKNVRVVDKWIRMNDMEQYYLHVGENEEVLYGRMDENESVCRRYKNESGLNVYEYYMQSGDYFHRMVYIPGTHFEIIRGTKGQNANDYMIADNTKGYWESYWVGVAPEHYNVSYMVMKNDICYDSFYDPKTGKIVFLKIISADKETDLFNYQGAEQDDLASINLHFSGFDGVAGIEADAKDVSQQDMGGEIGTIPLINETGARVRMKNGKILKAGDTFVDGKVELDVVRLSFYYPYYCGEVEVRIRADSVDEKLALFKAFIEETGFTCRRNLNTVLPGVKRAFKELAEITKYHTWNGVAQATEAGIAQAIKIEDADTLVFEKMIDDVRNAEVIDFNDKAVMETNIHFAPVSVSSIENAVQSGMNISIGKITLSVSDTLLFIEDEPYTVGVALKGDSGLVHLKKNSDTQTTAYKAGDSFSVSVENLALELPELVAGEYTLVAYIATADGVRSSAYTQVKIDTVDTNAVTLKQAQMTASKGADDALVIKYEPNTDLYVTFTKESAIGYDAFYAMLAEVVCDYGIPTDAAIEQLTAENTYTAMTEDETEIAIGSYRMAYSIQNGDQLVNAYLYAKYTA